jgi:hypothetical protein
VGDVTRSPLLYFTSSSVHDLSTRDSILNPLTETTESATSTSVNRTFQVDKLKLGNQSRTETSQRLITPRGSLGRRPSYPSVIVIVVVAFDELTALSSSYRQHGDAT